MTTTDVIREWLLGRLHAQEAEELETRLLEDDTFFEEVQAVEDDLFDDVAAGRMNEADRYAVSARRRTSADRSRLLFATALASRGAVAENVVRTSRFSRRRFFLAAAAVLLIAVTTLLVTSTRRNRDSVPTVVAGRQTTEPAPAPTAIAPQARQAIEVAIVIGTVRSDGDLTTIDIPPGNPPLSLRIEIDPQDVYDVYRIEMRPVAGDPLVFDDLDAVMADGRRTLTISLESQRLTSQSYELAVLGTNDGFEEPLGFHTVEVRRSPEP